MTDAELTAIRADVDRWATVARMTCREVAAMGSDVNDLQARLIHAVAPLVEEVERLQVENAKLRADLSVSDRMAAAAMHQMLEDIEAFSNTYHGGER